MSVISESTRVCGYEQGLQKLNLSPELRSSMTLGKSFTMSCFVK